MKRHDSAKKLKMLKMFVYGEFLMFFFNIRLCLLQSGGSRRLGGSTKPSSPTCPPCSRRSAAHPSQLSICSSSTNEPPEV